MALSAATFVFWNLFGARVLPAAFHQGSPVSLALQLSCSVLVYDKLTHEQAHFLILLLMDVYLLDKNTSMKYLLHNFC